MAKLSKEDVLKLAKLAKLNLSDEEIEQFQDEITSILDYVEQLHGANVDELEPTYQVTGLIDVMRKDEVKDYQASPKKLLNNAPETENGYIKVKRVIQ